MNDHSMRQKRCWLRRTALGALAMLFLHMVPSAAKEEAANAPSIVTTTPKQGALDVDPDLKEIRVTFDREMGKGMSWTGGPPNFPSIPDGAMPLWTDSRTCVLPVKLE